jgi:multidrug efflux system membrane fusion protein
MSRTAIVAACLGSWATVVLIGCGRVEGESAPPPRPVRVEAARPVDAPTRLRYSATLQPDLEISAAFSVGGYVHAVSTRRGADGRWRPLQAGDTVRAGEPLARLRDADYRERVHQADGAIGELEAAREKARLDLARARLLFDDESLTKPDLDAAIATASANEASLAAARAQRALAAIALADGVLRAPIGGVILERRLETGSLAQPGSPGFVIARLSPIKAVIGVPDLHVGRLRVGERLAMATAAFPGTRFAGAVTAIAPMADAQSRLYRVEVSLANEDGRLRPGMIGTIDLVPGNGAESTDPARIQARAERATDPAIPLAAVVRAADGRGYAVVIAEGSGDERIARIRRIALGDVRGNHVIVTGGLETGDEVISTAPSLLADGDRVRIVR